MRKVRQNKTHCKRGHKFTPSNTVKVFVNGEFTGRNCRACNLIRSRRRPKRDRKEYLKRWRNSEAGKASVKKGSLKYIHSKKGKETAGKWRSAHIGHIRRLARLSARKRYADPVYRQEYLLFLRSYRKRPHVRGKIAERHRRWRMSERGRAVSRRYRKLREKQLWYQLYRSLFNHIHIGKKREDQRRWRIRNRQYIRDKKRRLYYKSHEKSKRDMNERYWRKTWGGLSDLRKLHLNLMRELRNG